MKLSADALNDNNIDLQQYKKGKNSWVDYSGRIGTAEDVESRIARLQKKNGSEQDWIDLVLDLCKMAHQIQLYNTKYCSRIVETLY
jgi:hypothetical protein